MATWKKLTGAVDSSAQSFLKNKRFSREKKKFTWDWHAWNLALVSTPSLLIGYYLHGVEKQMHEEAAIREMIQERTGVGSRGFLIPKREVREEVLGMLSAGNQRGSIEGLEDSEDEDDEGGSGNNLPADYESIQRRLAAIESMLGVQGGSSSENAAEAGPGTDSSQGGKVPDGTNTTRDEDNARAETAHGKPTLDKAIETASAAGIWALRTGERQGQRLLQFGRDWLTKENRQEGPSLGGEAGFSKGETTVNRAPERANAETEQQGELPSGKSSDSIGVSVPSKTGGGTAEVSDSGGRVEGAWRRGRLDGNDKDR
eukprot:g2852.t1